MNTKLKTFILLCLSSTAFASDPRCRDPFEGISQSFILQETIEKQSNASHFPLRISNSSQAQYEPIGQGSSFFRMRCAEGFQVMNLVHTFGPNIVLGRCYLLEDEAGVFEVSSTCEEDKSSFILDTTPKKIPTGQAMVVADFTVYENNESENLLFYVQKGENFQDGILFRAPNGTLLAKAKKAYFEHSSTLDYANWRVENFGADPRILSYILTWKDNQAFKCWNPDPSWRAKKIAVATVGSIAGIIGIIGLIAYARNRYVLPRAYEPILDDVL